MRTELNTVNAIYAIIPTAVRPVYKFFYPDDISDDAFVVINTLGVPTDPIQTVEINVNCYAKDVSKKLGIADLAALDTMAGTIIDALHNYNNDAFDIEYEFMNLIRKESLKMHFLNLRFRLVYINN